MIPALAVLIALSLPSAAPAAGEARSETRPSLERHFARHGAEGSFVLFDPGRNTFVRYRPGRCAERFIPASTFKIFNTLAALETGVIEDENHVLKWDGVERFAKGWNEDQDLKTALRRSTVWYYQEVARRIGPERMKKLLERESYGNADISGGIDRFWLDGGLRISQEEQIEFLRRLYGRELHFSSRGMEITHRILLLEKTPRYELRGKTGWSKQEDLQIGWFVGWVETADNVYFFATNLESPDPDYKMNPARRRITRAILEELGVFPREESSSGFE